MEKILYEIVAKNEGFSDAFVNMDNLKKREQDILAQMKEIEKQGNIAKYSAQSAQEQSNAVQKYGKALEDERKKLKDVRTEIDKQEKSIEALSAAQKKLPGEVIAKNAEKSFRAVRKELTEQANQMKLTGQTGTQEYQKLIDKLGEMNDVAGDVSREVKGMASDTRGFDTLLEGTQLIAGGFSVAQGAAALFGVEEDKLQQMMVKLQAAIAITTGLQKVQNAIQKESNIMRGIAVLQTKAQATAENLKTAATGKGVVATAAATVAQKAFNVVAAMNPYVILAVALISVVGALVAFTAGANSAAKEQKKLNLEYKQWIDMVERKNNQSKERMNELLKGRENELSLMKQQGKSQDEIREKEHEILKLRENAAWGETVKRANKELLDDLEKNRKKLEEFNDALNYAEKTGKKVKIDGVKYNKEQLQSVIDNLTKDISVAISIRTDYETASQQLKEFEAETAKIQKENALKSAVSTAEARLTIAKKYSKEELTAQLQVLDTQKKQVLNNANLTEGEIKAINAKYNKDRKKLQKDYSDFWLSDEKTGLEAQIAAAKEGSAEQFNLKIQLLEKQKEIDLSNADLTANQRLKIEKEFIKDRNELYKNNNLETVVNSINVDNSYLNARLAAVKEGSAEELRLKQDLLDNSETLDIANAEHSIKNEAELTAKLLEIRANYNAERKKLNNDFSQNQTQQNYNQEILAAKQQYADGLLSKGEYEQKVRNLSISSLEQEIAERKAKGEETIELEQQLSEKRIEIAEQEKEARKQIFSALYDLMGEIGNAFFESQKQQLEQEMADFEHSYTTDAEAAKKNKDLKLISEQEYNRKQLEIKKKQAEAEKNQQIFKATMNAAQAVLSALASAPPPYNFILAAILARAAAIQVTAIVNKPLPKYAKGRRGGKGEFGLVGEWGKGAELMYIPAGASIMPESDTRRAFAGDYKVFDKWNIPRIDIPAIENKWLKNIPTINHKLIGEKAREFREKSEFSNINYDLLAAKIGEHVGKNVKFPEIKIPKQKAVSVNVNRSGISVTEGNTTTNVLNEKYAGIF